MFELIRYLILKYEIFKSYINTNNLFKSSYMVFIQRLK